MSPQVLPVQKQKAVEIGEFLTNNVSRAAVYALLHKQPLTRKEIERSPMTDSMRRLSLSAQTRSLKDKSNVQMRTLLAKGVECGVLLPVNSKRQNYYFLNSDLRIEPAPVRDPAEDEGRGGPECLPRQDLRPHTGTRGAACMGHGGGPHHPAGAVHRLPEDIRTVAQLAHHPHQEGGPELHRSTTARSRGRSSARTWGSGRTGSSLRRGFRAA